MAERSDAAGRALPPGMIRALGAAGKGRGRTSPNPVVGASLAIGGAIVGVSHHARFGGPHAEARLLDGAGELPAGAVLYVTLEPCCHHGKTPPCVERIIAARPSKVVVASLDPDIRARGRGVDRLVKAGIPVEIGVGEMEALSGAVAYHLRQRLGRSLLRLKLAASLDARLAAGSGQSRWITGASARRMVHRERSLFDAVVVGAGTVAVDDPMLNVREVAGPQPSRIVLDSTLRSPPRCRLWRAWRADLQAAGSKAGSPLLRRPGIRDQDGSVVPGAAAYRFGGPAGTGNYLPVRMKGGVRYLRRPRLILATMSGWPEERVRPYRDAGWEIWDLPPKRRGSVGLELIAFARRSAREGFLSVLVEGGPRLAGGLLEEDLADEISLYEAPVVLGGANLWPFGWAAPSLGRARRYARIGERKAGEDRWTVLRREGLLEKVRTRAAG